MYFSLICIDFTVLILITFLIKYGKPFNSFMFLIVSVQAETEEYESYIWGTMMSLIRFWFYKFTSRNVSLKNKHKKVHSKF